MWFFFPLAVFWTRQFQLCPFEWQWFLSCLPTWQTPGLLSPVSTGISRNNLPVRIIIQFCLSPSGLKDYGHPRSRGTVHTNDRLLQKMSCGDIPVLLASRMSWGCILSCMISAHVAFVYVYDKMANIKITSDLEILRTWNSSWTAGLSRETSCSSKDKLFSILLKF